MSTVRRILRSRQDGGVRAPAADSNDRATAAAVWLLFLGSGCVLPAGVWALDRRRPASLGYRHAKAATALGALYLPAWVSTLAWSLAQPDDLASDLPPWQLVAVAAVAVLVTSIGLVVALTAPIGEIDGLAPPAPPPPSVFRRPVVNGVLGMCAAVMAFVCLSGVFVTATDTAPSPDQRVVCVVGLAFFAWLAGRVWRLAVLADEEGIVVRNVVRTRGFRWEEIKDFRSPATWGTMRHLGLKIDLCNGETVTASAFTHGALDGPDFADRTVEALRNRLLRRRASEPSACAPTT